VFIKDIFLFDFRGPPFIASKKIENSTSYIILALYLVYFLKVLQ